VSVKESPSEDPFARETSSENEFRGESKLSTSE
jgi:hypothetical protein